MVDWTLARQLAGLVAGREPVPDLGVDFRTLCLELEPHLVHYTGLAAARPLPPVETVSRGDWAEANLATLTDLLDPVAERLAHRLPGGAFAEPLRTLTGAALAAEVGLVLGYLAQRVLGQYELSLLQPTAPPRLLFVGPNLDKTARELGLDRPSFLSWIALHELTHVLEFSGVPWLREHLAGLLREYLDSVEVRLERPGLAALRDPAKLAEAFREGGIAALVQDPRQRAVFERVQAVMAVVEGYSEHVMDAVGAEVLSSYTGMREAMERRRRSRSAPERALQRLLGLDLKLRQYELGKGFCDAVVAAGGITALNRVWEAPAALPTLAEIEDPDAWRARLERQRPALVQGEGAERA